MFSTIIGRAGNYGSDSTGENLTLTTVPEPATWGLMIVGVAMAGAAARRRTTTLAD